MYLLDKFSTNEVVAPARAQATKRSARFQLYGTLLVLDCLCIALCFWVVGTLVGWRWFNAQSLNLAAMIIPIYVGVAINGNAYTLGSITRPAQAAGHAILSMIFSMCAVQCVLYFAHSSESFSRLSFGLGGLLSALVMAAIRRPFSTYSSSKIRGGLLDEIVIIDGIDVDLPAHVQTINAHEYHLKPDLNDPYMLNHLGKWLRTFDRVVIACPPSRRQAWTIILQGAGIQGEILIPEKSGVRAIGIGELQGFGTHVVSRSALSVANSIQKRALDIALTVPAIILLSPLLLLVAIAIKLDSPGTVLFMQPRVGLGNRLFRIMKFRSMRAETTDNAGNVSASRTDDRQTRVGRFIRRTSIDELPQLFNVLLGDMSIVGPRPHALGSTADSKLFWEVNQHYWCRHALKPGITGLAQIRGFRGATECEADLENRLSADLEYLKDWSLVAEIEIMLRTVLVLVHKNAY
ncbi:sugar transferase [Sphingobium sp. KCTC 72723]|uniref:sugar transferase n=1 Tax=Sphingobium sp. KCTC 72723 TaxID=2733867 RepID=UPI0021CF92C2|nr:sugar transferase [Sphingobium sp. KCTC 72723]